MNGVPHPIRVVVTDDEELVREGLSVIVNSHPDLDVVGTASNGVESVALVKKLQPDVVLMDIRMPDGDGIEATRQIVSSPSAARVLILTTVELDDVVYAALRAGASGFLLKSVPREQLWSGIKAVAAGDTLLAPTLTRRLIEAHLETSRSASALPQLSMTERQADVTRLVARGYSNKEIGAELFLAETTVKGYVSEVLTKHGLRDRTQLVVLAYESGLVRPGQV